MKKRKVIATLLLSSVLAASCMSFASCDLIGSILGTKDSSSSSVEEETVSYDIVWDVPDNVTVTAEGSAALPSTAVRNETVTFTVTVPAGYTAVVKAGTSTLSQSDGKYSTKITKDVTISITLERAVASISVTPPEKLSDYFEGDVVDTAGMTVTVHYEDGSSEQITDGYTISPAAFVGGETSFTVTYKGKTETVQLDQAVQTREFGMTSVRLEVVDGKPYYVLTGTYSNYDVDKFGSIGFDFQHQGFYNQNMNGTSAVWTYVKYNLEIDEFENGVFTLRVDMSALMDTLDESNPTRMFNPHMGFEEPGDNKNPNVVVEEYEEGQTIQIGDYTFTLHVEKSEDDQTMTTWGMAAVIVTNTVLMPSTDNTETPEE